MFYAMIFSGSNLSVAEPVPPSIGDSDGLVVEETKGSAKSSEDCKTAGDVASKNSCTPFGSIHQSTETGSI